MTESKIIGIRFTPAELEIIDEIVKNEGYKNRTECIKELIKDKAQGLPSPTVKSAVLEILRTDPDVRAVFQELTQKTIQTTFDTVMKMNINL